MHNGGRTVAKCAPPPFCFAKHMMCIGSKNLCADTKVGTQALCVRCLEHRVRVELDDGRKSGRGSDMFCVQVLDFQEGGLEVRAGLVF
jgi:hypothetical protein